MADLSSSVPKPANANTEGDDLLSVLNREAKQAIKRIADQLHLPHQPRTGLHADAKYRLVCQAYEARRERMHIFDADLFADPAWDILLAMFREHLAARPMTLADAVKSADVPHSTGMRWLAVLANKRLISRPSAETVELTPAAIEKLEAYLERLRTKSLMRVI